MKVAVVTGIARTAGIGHAICKSLLDSGLAVIGLDKIQMHATSPLLEHPDFVSYVASVTSVKEVSDGISMGLSKLQKSHISVVVNNAGISQPFLQSPPCTTTTKSHDDSTKNEEMIARRIEEFDDYLAVNLKSAFLVTEVCRPYFPESGVSVIHIASTRAYQSPALSADECPFGQEGYASAKAGMIGLMQSQGQSLAGQARVNVILPGWIDTQDPSEENYCEPTQKDHAWHSVGRVGTPKDIANIVSFLADDEKSGFITCQEFVIDGGVSRKMVYPE